MKAGRVLLVLLPFICALSCSTPSDAFSDHSATTGTTSRFTHVISSETAYYLDGPEQGRPYDGTFYPGTKVVFLTSGGSYSKVRAQNGTEAWVSTDSLKPISP